MTSGVSSVAILESEHVEGQVHHITQSTVMTDRDAKDDKSCSNAQNSKRILVVGTTVYVKADANNEFLKIVNSLENLSEILIVFLNL
jgi:hypothetical protein